MSRISRFAMLAAVTALAGCGDHTSPVPPSSESSSPTEVPAPVSRPAPDEAAIRERLARRVARALGSASFRAYVKSQLDASPVREHKLQLQRFIGAADRHALRELARVGGESEAAVEGDTRRAIPLEMYFPVPEHRARWAGDENVFVATERDEREIPVAYDTKGRRHLLSPDAPPDTPVLAIVPVETDFDQPSSPAPFICCAGGGPTAPAGLYMTANHFVQDFESGANAGDVLLLRYLQRGSGAGDHPGDHRVPFSLPFGLLLVLQCCDRLPPIAVVLAGHEAAVDLKHHDRISVAELPGYDFGRRACLRCPNRPAMAAIPELVTGDPKSFTDLAVMVSDVASLEAGEQRRLGQLPCAERLDVGPSPLRHAHDPLPAVRLCAGRKDLPSGEIHVSAPEPKRHRYLDACSVENREVFPPGAHLRINHALHVGLGEIGDPRLVTLGWGEVAEWALLERPDLPAVGKE
jgi:hypothetical protein